jgi:hypothetical protein
LCPGHDGMSALLVQNSSSLVDGPRVICCWYGLVTSSPGRASGSSVAAASRGWMCNPVVPAPLGIRRFACAIQVAVTDNPVCCGTARWSGTARFWADWEWRPMCGSSLLCLALDRLGENCVIRGRLGPSALQGASCPSLPCLALHRLVYFPTWCFGVALVQGRRGGLLSLWTLGCI